MGPKALQLRGKRFKFCPRKSFKLPAEGATEEQPWKKKSSKLSYGKTTISKIVRQKAKWEK